MIEQANPVELTETDFKWLSKMVDGYYRGARPIHLVKDAMEGRALLWRLTGDQEGMMVTQVLLHPAGKEVLVWGLAGENLKMLPLADAVENYAKEHEAKWIGAQTSSPAMEKLFSRLNGKSISRYWLKEVKDAPLESA